MSKQLIDRLMTVGMEGNFYASRQGDKFYSPQTKKMYTEKELQDLRILSPKLNMTVWNIIKDDRDTIEIEGAKVVNLIKTY